jgi:hypothetical protein
VFTHQSIAVKNPGNSIRLNTAPHYKGKSSR